MCKSKTKNDRLFCCESVRDFDLTFKKDYSIESYIFSYEARYTYYEIKKQKQYISAYCFLFYIQYEFMKKARITKQFV